MSWVVPCRAMSWVTRAALASRGIGRGGLCSCQTFEVNVFGAHRLTQLLLPDLRASQARRRRILSLLLHAAMSRCALHATRQLFFTHAGPCRQHRQRRGPDCDAARVDVFSDEVCSRSAHRRSAPRGALIRTEYDYPYLSIYMHP